jgi:hypothetical protein
MFNRSFQSKLLDQFETDGRTRLATCCCCCCCRQSTNRSSPAEFCSWNGSAHVGQVCRCGCARDVLLALCRPVSNVLDESWLAAQSRHGITGRTTKVSMEPRRAGRTPAHSLAFVPSSGRSVPAEWRRQAAAVVSCRLDGQFQPAQSRLSAWAQSAANARQHAGRKVYSTYHCNCVALCHLRRAYQSSAARIAAAAVVVA